MEKSYKIDKIDAKIMRQLEIDSRQPFSRMAKKAGINAETAKSRLERLKQTGIVSRLWAEPNLEALDLKTFRLYAQLVGMTPQQQSRLFRQYAQNPCVHWVALGQGAWNLVIRFSLTNEERFKNEVEAFMNEYGPYVKRKTIALGAYQTYLPMTHFLATPRNRRVLAHQKKNPPRLTNKDFEILNALYEDARMATTKIAVRLHMTPEAVQYRLKRLNAFGAIDHYLPWFDASKLGFEYYKVFLWLERPTPEKEAGLIRHLESQPNIVFLTRVIGDWDLEIDLHVRNPTQLNDILNEIAAHHADLIRDQTSMVILQNDLGNPIRQFVDGKP